MSKFDLAVTDGRGIDPDRIVADDWLGVRNGCIVARGEREPPRGREHFDTSGLWMIVARSGTLEPVIDKVSRKLHTMVGARFRQCYEGLGAFATGTTAQELNAFVREKSARWTAVVETVGIEPN